VTPLIESGYTGKGVTVAVVGWARDSSFFDDIQGFDQTYGLPNASVTVVTPYGSDGTLANHSVYTGEVTADVELVHAMAPGAKILVVLSGYWDFLKALDYTIENNLAGVITTSYANAFPGGLVGSYEEAFATSVNESITLVAPSGDSGSNFTAPSNSYTLPVPANLTVLPTFSPYFTVVGGTELVAPGPPAEWAWEYSGGGPSTFPQPSWQAGPGVPMNGYRDIPDVSLDASCETPYDEYWNGAPSASCGTSDAAPTFAGIIADVEQAAGHRLGFLNPSLYALARSDPTAFHEITNGYSLAVVDGNLEPGYCASPGWNFVTGLGSPDAVNLLRFFAPGAALNGTALGEANSTQTASTESISARTATVCPAFVRPAPPFRSGTAIAVAAVAGTALVVLSAVAIRRWRKNAPKEVQTTVPPWD